MSTLDIQRLSETAKHPIIAFRVVADQLALALHAGRGLLVEVLGPFGVAAISGALLVIAMEWVRWLTS
jgi:hypothetical protein